MPPWLLTEASGSPGLAPAQALIPQGLRPQAQLLSGTGCKTRLKILTCFLTLKGLQLECNPHTTQAPVQLPLPVPTNRLGKAVYCSSCKDHQAALSVTACNKDCSTWQSCLDQTGYDEEKALVVVVVVVVVVIVVVVVLRSNGSMT